MFESYVQEFIAVCDYLRKSDCRRTKGFFVVEKVYIEDMLNKNKYETALNKLKAWKALNWISTDKDRLTCRIYSKESRKYISCIRISLDVYETLKNLNKVHDK